MSYALIRQALETRLNAMTPSLPAAWENVSFNQVATGYQRVTILPGKTQNPTFGDTLKRETGIMQVSLCYPIGTGSAAALARAEAVRAWFYRGLSLTVSGVTVIIGGTPSIAPAINEPGFYVVPVSIPYFSDIT